MKNMTSDNTGRICNAHVVHADISEKGAMDEKCIHLAELAATAVDAHKTGQNVKMPPYLRPKEYPDFMGKADDISYRSGKILGRLYRSVKSYIHGRRPRSPDGLARNDVPYYDTDLEVAGASVFFAEAWECKCAYEAQLNVLLNQFSVQTEAEIVTGEMWSLNENNVRKKKDTKEKVKYAYSELQQQFRSVFEGMEVAGRCREVSGERKDMAYEMKASAWYQVTYHPVWVRRSRELEPDGTAKLSFAWIAVDYLARIKMRRRQARSKS
jgi:RNA-dependent RNA polymerase